MARIKGGNRLDDAARAGWLYDVAGNTQDEIARKPGVVGQAERLPRTDEGRGPSRRLVQRVARTRPFTPQGLNGRAPRIFSCAACRVIHIQRGGQQE